MSLRNTRSLITEQCKILIKSNISRLTKFNVNKDERTREEANGFLLKLV